MADDPCTGPGASLQESQIAAKDRQIIQRRRLSLVPIRDGGQLNGELIRIAKLGASRQSSGWSAARITLAPRGPADDWSASSRAGSGRSAARCQRARHPGDCRPASQARARIVSMGLGGGEGLAR